MHVRYPVWLKTVGRPGAYVFAVMFALDSLSRALLSTVIALQALALLGDARDVSIVFSLVGVAGLVASFSIPWLVRRLTRRHVYSLGALLIVAAAAMFATVTVSGQIAGLMLRVYGAACLSITTSLYIMQYINRRELTRSEPLRLQYSGVAWTLGPWLGVKLYESLGPGWAYGASAATALVLLVFFWFLRVTENPAVPRAVKPPPSAAASIGRFIAQPRLRLAWVIVLGRSTWWVFFFVYTPVYMLESGRSHEAAAIVVSAGNAVLFLAPLFGRLGERYRLRAVLGTAFVVVGLATALAGASFAAPSAVVMFLMIGALGCAALDSVGNIPFIRAVHPHERPQMTTVFRTYIDVAELLTPALFAVLLTFADLRSVFIVYGLIVVSFAVWPWLLPRRL